ncbi:MAG: DUF1552 domain-containing protein [Planctomycetaceae bacterium]
MFTQPHGDRPLLSRRNFLRGASVSRLGLPMLESLGSSAATAESPRRLAYVYVPNGMNMPMFTPEGSGTDWRLSPTLQPLANRRDQLTVFSGLSNLPGGIDVPAITVHARASSTFLTNRGLAQPDGSFRNGLSVDQLAAREIGYQTRFPSLQLCCAGHEMRGQTEAIYIRTMSWTEEGTPLTGETHPRAVFGRLFIEAGGNRDALQAWQHNRRSVLDFVQEDARRLQGRIAIADRQKLDEYLTSVRAVEKVIQRAADVGPPPVGTVRPNDIPEEPGDYMNVMFDLAKLAFQTDQTRVLTLMLGEESSDEQYDAINIAEPYHKISHHANNPDDLRKIAEIDHYHVGLFESFLQRLEQTPSGAGNLLNDTTVLYGSGLSNGNAHSFANLPLVLAGGTAGAVRHRGHLQLPANTPVANLHRTLLRTLRVETDGFGDSTGFIDELQVA